MQCYTYVIILYILCRFYKFCIFFCKIYILLIFTRLIQVLFFRMNPFSIYFLTLKKLTKHIDYLDMLHIDILKSRLITSNTMDTVFRNNSNLFIISILNYISRIEALNFLAYIIEFFLWISLFVPPIIIYYFFLKNVFLRILQLNLIIYSVIYTRLLKRYLFNL